MYIEWTGGRAACCIFGFIASIFFGVVFVVIIKAGLLVWLAPKVWLLKELAQRQVRHDISWKAAYKSDMEIYERLKQKLGQS
jgi:hypothetical protein